jgi:acyl-coenzyme A thioesterase PaaI-like protein
VSSQAVQDRYAPHGICFGCGPANEKGLRIKSRWEGDDLVMRFTPKPEHQAFPGVVNGGILGALLDCHGNWCASMTLLKQRGLDEAPTTVTAEFHVKLKRPTPFGQELVVTARPTKVEGDMVWVHAEVKAGEKVTATCEGVFVAVKPGHPAYHRWG